MDDIEILIANFDYLFLDTGARNCSSSEDVCSCIASFSSSSKIHSE
jgi:hypothetical protein